MAAMFQQLKKKLDKTKNKKNPVSCLAWLHSFGNKMQDLTETLQLKVLFKNTVDEASEIRTDYPHFWTLVYNVSV